MAWKFEILYYISYDSQCRCVTLSIHFRWSQNIIATQRNSGRTNNIHLMKDHIGWREVKFPYSRVTISFGFLVNDHCQNCLFLLHSYRGVVCLLLPKMHFEDISDLTLQARLLQAKVFENQPPRSSSLPLQPFEFIFIEFHVLQIPSPPDLPPRQHLCLHRRNYPRPSRDRANS